MKKDDLLKTIFDIEQEHEAITGISIYDHVLNKKGLAKLAKDGNGIKILIGDDEEKLDYIIYYSYQPEYANAPDYENSICINNLETNRIEIYEIFNAFSREVYQTLNNYLEP